MEGGITQDDHAAVKRPDQPLKRVVSDIRGGTVPPYHEAILVQQQTEFPADNPAMVGQAFAPDLLRAAPLTHGVDQLDAIGVDDAEHRWRSQERPRPVLMGLEETKEPGALGEPRKQRPIVARQPPIEGPVAYAFEGMEQPQGDDLAGPEVGLGMFGDGAQLLIDFIE